ncbi:MAG: NADH-quinone oxidoreductase subunit C [Anaerolineae bacterium]|nr:NADH-quinone oxidoreductase subunit C [Anaerolineae bacterium]
MIKDALSTLQAQFGEAVGGQALFREQTSLVVTDLQQLVPIVTALRDTPGLEYLMLVSITAVDWYNQPEAPGTARFQVSYQLLSLRYNHRLRLLVYWDEGDAPIPSITSVYPSANWEERETWDMFGVEFSGHPDLRRLLMPPDWDGYPLRRDYPLGYETVQFSFNVDEINKHKPFAKE